MTSQEISFISDLNKLLEKHRCLVSIYPMYVDDDEALNMSIVGYGSEGEDIEYFQHPINLQLNDLKEILDNDSKKS